MNSLDRIPSPFREIIHDFAKLVAAEVIALNKESKAPVPLKDAAKMLSKSREHLRNEVNAGRVRRVPGTNKILIPFAEIERLRAGEAITKR